MDGADVYHCVRVSIGDDGVMDGPVRTVNTADCDASRWQAWPAWDMAAHAISDMTIAHKAPSHHHLIPCLLFSSGRAQPSPAHRIALSSCCCMATADGPQSAPATDVPPPLDSRTSNLEGNVFIVGESPEDRARRERKRQLRILNSKAWASEKGNTLQANQVNWSSVSTRAVA